MGRRRTRLLERFKTVTMTNKELIIKILKTDLDVYNDMVFTSFIEWCKLTCAFNIPLKLLVNNESLFNWYLNQFKTLVEDTFINDNKDFIGLCTDQNHWLDTFKTYPAEIENYYPRVLLKMIKDTIKTKV